MLMIAHCILHNVLRNRGYMIDRINQGWKPREIVCGMVFTLDKLIKNAGLPLS